MLSTVHCHKLTSSKQETLEIILGFRPKRAAHVIVFPVFPPPWTCQTKNHKQTLLILVITLLQLGSDHSGEVI